MIEERFKDWKKKKPKPDGKLVKDEECARCKRWMECTGKERGMNCLAFVRR